MYSILCRNFLQGLYLSGLITLCAAGITSGEAESQGISGIVASDEFDEIPENGDQEDSILKGLPLVWQWNHNPLDEYWSLSDRPGK